MRLLPSLALVIAAFLLLPFPASAGDTSTRPLTVVVLGDAGEGNSRLHTNASYLTAMFTEEHDGGVFDAMIFLGNNFFERGLNIPADDVSGTVKSVLWGFKKPFDKLGRSRILAIPGNNDYYSSIAVDEETLLGSNKSGPYGLNDKGNRREAEIESWTYYSHLPAQVVLPLGGDSRDSVQFVFFDSALLLRTDTSTWHVALDSLSRLLSASRGRSGIVWRVLSTHHPLMSGGEHAGYTEWNDDSSRVEYLTSCDKDTNGLGWLKNMLDPEDMCTAKYKRYVEDMHQAIRQAGVPVQVVLSGHEHSLQLLFDDGGQMPRVQLISGAASRMARAKLSAPPNYYSSAQASESDEGRSFPGFAQLKFLGRTVQVRFFNGARGKFVDLSGRDVFTITDAGNLTRE